MAFVVAVCAVPATAQAAPVNLSKPSIVGPPQVGGRLHCLAGSWGTTEPGGRAVTGGYQWFLSTDLVDPLPPTANRAYYYNVREPDTGTQLVCRVTERDTKDRTTATADSLASPVITSLLSVTITEFSTVVSGNIGEALAGVTVTANLVRDTSTIATATVTTNSSGGWSAALSPATAGPGHGVDPGDALVTHYSAPSADPDASVPADFTYGAPGDNFFATGVISADGTSVKVGSPIFPVACRQLRVLINGAQLSPSQSGPNCIATPAGPVSDNDDVRVQASRKLQESDVVSVARYRARTGLVGGAAALPTCSGDLVTGAVTCGPLTTGQFAIALNGGSPVPLVAEGSSGTATLPRSKPGDVVTLDETSPAPTTRHLTTLHVLRLQASLAAGTFVSGACQPGEPIADTVCPSTGITPVVADPLRLLDDRSGGGLTVTVPSLTDMIPTQNASLSSGTFMSYVDLAGDQSASQLMAETRVVHLTIRPRGSQTAIVSRNMTPGSDSDGAFASADVTGLSVGRYFADWLLTDTNGDTNRFETLFAVQSSGGT